MSTEANKATTTEFLRALVKRDTAHMSRLMADDATYWALGKPHLFPLSGERPKADWLKIMSGPSSFKDGLAIEIGPLTAEGDRVSAIAETRGLAPSGMLYNNHYHFLFTFRDGMIVNIREFMDTQHAAEVFN